jgi:hypothetical protein
VTAGVVAIGAVISGISGNWQIDRRSVFASVYGSWTSAATGTGDGATLIAGVGVYQWRCTELGSGTVSSTVFQPASAEGDCPWNRCIPMIGDRIDAMSMGVFDSTEKQQKALADLDVDLTEAKPRCLLVSAVGGTEQKMGGPINKDDIGYPVQVVMLESLKGIAVDDGGLDKHADRYRAVRHKIDRACDNQTWDLRVPECWLVKSQTGVAIDVGYLGKDRIRIALLTMLCICRESRGPWVRVGF